MNPLTPGLDIAPAPSQEELARLLDEYIAVACEPGAARERLDAWAPIRAAARRHWEELLEAERFGQDVSEAATWKLLPHEDGPLARRHVAFVHPLAPAVGRDVHAWFEGAGWVHPGQWPELGRGLFDLVRRSTEHPAELWPAIEAYLAIPGAAAFTTEMISPVLHALRPNEFVLVDAACRALLNHATGSSFSGTLRDFPAAHAAARRLLAELRPALAASLLSDRRPEDVLEGFCHWMVHVRLMRRDEETNPANGGPGEAAPRAAKERELEPAAEAIGAEPPEAIESAADRVAESAPPAELMVSPELEDEPLAAPEPDAALVEPPSELTSPAAEPVQPEPAATDVQLTPATPAPASPPAAPATLAPIDRARAALERRGQLVLAGPPRSGKSQLALALAEQLVAGGDGFVEHIVFHPSWRYADFMQAVGADGARCTGLFPAFCQQAAARRGPCVLLVDDAERADAAAVCGEALALLDLRDRTIVLAGGGTLAVPANVRLIFTLDGGSCAGRAALAELMRVCDVLRLDGDDEG